MTSCELFATMPPALAADILEYVFTNDKKLYWTALDAVAQVRKVRSIFLERHPRSERFIAMAATLSRPPLVLVANSLISTWLLKKHLPMLVAFLDALKIQHDKGVVETLPSSVEDAALQSAVEVLLGKFPPEVVAVYLHAFNELNEARWANLSAMLANHPQLQFRRDS